jgi:hypothetical protein
MPIPVLNFPYQDFEQANPGIVGASYANDLLAKAIENQKNIVSSRYMQPHLDEQLQQLKLNTDILRPKAQYANQFTEAELAQSLMNAPRVKAEIDRIYKSEIPLGQAHAGYYNAQEELLPDKLALGKARLNQSLNRFGPEALTLRSLQSPQMQALISSNPEIAHNVAQLLANVSQKGMPANGINAQQSSIQLTPDDISSLQEKTADVLTKRTATAQVLNQRQYAIVLDSLFDEGSKLMPSVVSYAGAQGKVNLAKDAARASLGEVSPRYSEYLQFTNVVAPNTANEMRRVLGGQATDYEAKVMNNLSNPSFWLTNPKLAMEQWNFMQNMFRKKIGPALTTGLSGAVKKIEQGAMDTSPIQNVPSDEDLQYTAKTRGMTVEQVKQKLGIK